MAAANGVIYGGPHDGKVVVVPDGATGVTLQEALPDPNRPGSNMMVAVRYEVPDRDRTDGYGRLRLLRLHPGKVT